jgi:hypothetical protein
MSMVINNFKALLIGEEGASGIRWIGETPQELATRRLTASKEEFVL